MATAPHNPATPVFQAPVPLQAAPYKDWGRGHQKAPLIQTHFSKGAGTKPESQSTWRRVLDRASKRAATTLHQLTHELTAATSQQEA